jgi:NADPH:quinone reductase-like Zn-dependent oxidoreductase
MAQMKAIRIHAYGEPEVLIYEDAPKQQPEEGEVLIRVHAASINPIDWKIRSGYMKAMVDLRLPLILGWDASGEVVSTGAGVTEFKVGDAVYTMLGMKAGAYAEYVTVSASLVALKPQSLNYIDAAALPLVSLTAWQALFDLAELKEGQRLLIHGAAGGLGSTAVQLAKAKGAYVVGTCSSNNVEFLHQLNVDEVIDYRTTKFEDIARDIDVVFDTVGGETLERSFSVLKKGGFLVSAVNPPSEAVSTAHSVRSAKVFAKPNGVRLKELATLIDAGLVKPIVETILPLKEVRKAHESSQSGHTRGKIVLQVI